MRKRLFFTILAILLLSTWLGNAHNNETTSLETVTAEVTGASAAPGWSLYGFYPELAIPTQNTDSSRQAVESRNPTFQEVRDFILKDPTNRNRFALNQYECRHFAIEVNNNAEANGLRCAFVLLCYDTGQHAVVAFDTVDRGLIYIEPQIDAAIHPEVGGTYQGKEIKEILIAW